MVNTPHQEAAVSITVKNTFLNIKETKAPVRRCSSVPRAFKLGGPVGAEWPENDDSTSATDSTNDKDVPDYCSECTEDQEFYEYYSGMSSPTDAADETDKNGKTLSLSDMVSDDADVKVEVKGKSTLSLADMVREGSDEEDSGLGSKFKLSLADTVTEESRRKLRPCATPFMSKRTPPSEVLALLANAIEVLSCGPDISDVQVQDGGMGGTTVIVANSLRQNPNSQMIFSLVKDAVLTSAEQSENTYIMGYGAQPFKSLDDMSFSMSIGCVPAAHQETACWDTYEKGFCPRCKSCRWDHPADTDIMRVVVMIKAPMELQ